MLPATAGDPGTSLRVAGLLGATEEAEFLPLTGGVSSEILLVRTAAGRRFVVKRALSKLKVKDDWFADTQRNRVEQAYFAQVAPIVPTAVPRVLHNGDTWFAMEYLGNGLTTWKSELLAGRANPVHARWAGETLGRIHRASWDNATMRSTFASGRNFYDLRIEPYLLTTGRRLPALQDMFETEAARLAGCGLALVHGDYSPKNLMVSETRLVVLDAEVAWFGDPAFDLAFMLTHLHLKLLVTSSCSGQILALIPAFWNSYRMALGDVIDPTLEARTTRLLLMLMLARVHGKSPVEYLTFAQQHAVTEFGSTSLTKSPGKLASLTAAWTSVINPT